MLTKKILQFCACVILAANLAWSAQASHAKEPVDYVNPNIGTIGHLLTATAPYVQYPHGMVRVAPVTTPGLEDRYLADKIYGFPAGPATLMAATGDLSFDPAKMASHYDHDFETATPYWYKVRLDDSDVVAEATATPLVAYYRFTFPAAPHGYLALHIRSGEIEVVGPNSVSGFGNSGGSEETDGVRFYFYAEFSRPVAGYRTWKGSNLSEEARQSGDRIGFATDFRARAGQPVEVRVGISYIGVDQAKKNLADEAPNWGFDAVKAKARSVWNHTLNAITIKGGTERQRTVFYTGLYRTLCRMTDITESGRYYSGYDRRCMPPKATIFTWMTDSGTLIGVRTRSRF